MAERPSELAERMFANAGMKTARLSQGTSNELAAALYDISRGLESMAVGMRAIYIKLESLETENKNRLKENKNPLIGGFATGHSTR
jgi:hypothetical protein